MKKLSILFVLMLSINLFSNLQVHAAESNPVPRLLPKDNYVVEKDYIIFSGVTKGEGDECTLNVELSPYDTMNNYKTFTSHPVTCGERVSITVPHLSNNTWYWRAYTESEKGYGEYSEVRKFEIERPNTAPYITFSLTPDNTIVADDDIDLKVIVKDRENDHVRLQFEVSKDPEFKYYSTFYTGYKESDSEVIRNISNLTEGTYYWRVKAHDDWDYSYSEYTKVRSFKVINYG